MRSNYFGDIWLQYSSVHSKIIRIIHLSVHIYKCLYEKSTMLNLFWDGKQSSQLPES